MSPFMYPTGFNLTRAKNKRAPRLQEGLLNRLFATFELSPRLPFRVVGEQGRWRADRGLFRFRHPRLFNGIEMGEGPLA
jgi:hypothetical protein